MPFILAGTGLMLIAACSSKDAETATGNNARADNGASGFPCVVGNGENMMDKVSEDLCAEFDKRKDDSSYEEQVVITLKKDAPRPDFSASGITLVSEMKNAPIVVARVNGAGLNALSKLDGVERIERDGEMRALDN